MIYPNTYWWKLVTTCQSQEEIERQIKHTFLKLGIKVNKNLEVPWQTWKKLMSDDKFKNKKMDEATN